MEFGIPTSSSSACDKLEQLKTHQLWHVEQHLQGVEGIFSVMPDAVWNRALTNCELQPMKSIEKLCNQHVDNLFKPRWFDWKRSPYSSLSTFSRKGLPLFTNNSQTRSRKGPVYYKYHPRSKPNLLLFPSLWRLVIGRAYVILSKLKD